MVHKEERKAKKREAGVLIVDDHPLVRRGLVQLIEQEAGLRVCGEAADVADALDAAAKLKPDIVIVDVSLKGRDGIELVKILKGLYPKLPVLVLSMHDESLYAERSLRAGAKGYVMKTEAPEKVALAIRQILGGKIYVSGEVASGILHKFVGGKPGLVGSPLDVLSDRELEVFQLIGTGLGARRIADELHLSVKTIESHCAHIKEKLKLRDSAELTQHAVQWVESENAS